MYEEWAYKEEPAVRLIIRAGGNIPVELGSRDWTLVGPCAVSPEIERDIAEKGFHYSRRGAPIADPGRLKDSNAAGA